MPLEKLDLLEQRVTQMVEIINKLQTENRSLEEQLANLTTRLSEMTHEAETSRQELDNLNRIQEEHQRFLEERGQVYAKLETMLRGLDGIGI